MHFAKFLHLIQSQWRAFYCKCVWYSHTISGEQSVKDVHISKYAMKMCHGVKTASKYFALNHRVFWDMAPFYMHYEGAGGVATWLSYPSTQSPKAPTHNLPNLLRGSEDPSEPIFRSVEGGTGLLAQVPFAIVPDVPVVIANELPWEASLNWMADSRFAPGF